MPAWARLRAGFSERRIFIDRGLFTTRCRRCLSKGRVVLGECVVAREIQGGWSSKWSWLHFWYFSLLFATAAGSMMIMVLEDDKFGRLAGVLVAWFSVDTAKGGRGPENACFCSTRLACMCTVISRFSTLRYLRGHLQLVVA